MSDRNLQTIEKSIRLSPFASSRPKKKKFHLQEVHEWIYATSRQQPFQIQVYQVRTMTNWGTMKDLNFRKTAQRRGMTEIFNGSGGCSVALGQAVAVRVCGEASPLFFSCRRHLKFSHERVCNTRYWTPPLQESRTKNTKSASLETSH
jgi:hypothetical protein